MARFVSRIVISSARSTLIGHEANASFVIASRRSNSVNFVRTIASGVRRCQAAERRYTDKHEWVTVNGNIGIVGISNYAQDALGDVVYAQLPDVGTLIKKEEECGALESVKAASEIMSPCSGKVIEKNQDVESKPGLVNSSCYDDGWLFKIELNDPEEVKTLMDEKAYKEFLEANPH